MFIYCTYFLVVATEGANIGMFAIFAATHFSQEQSSTSPPLEFVCIEPIAENFALLARNIEKFGLHATAVNVALGSSTDDDADGDAGSSVTQKQSTDNSMLKVRNLHVWGRDLVCCRCL